MSSFAMAARGPKARYYPGVNSLAIFSAQGSNPLQDCKLFGKGVAKVYDKSVKGYVYSITGGLQSKLQLPKDESRIGLQLLQPFLVLQVFVPQGVHFSIELRVSDINNTRRKMYFSTSFSEVKSTPLHCQIPISMVMRNKWLTLALHVADMFNSCFRGSAGMNFRSIDVIVLGNVCKLRKIFTMRCRIIEANPKGYLDEPIEEASENYLPQEHSYALGVENCIQTLDMASIQSALANGNDAHHDHDSRWGPDTGLSARKVGTKQQPPENTKSVHVAFGTRMPLPLSTVHINTNLPHDKCPTLVKDRIGKVHFVSDPSAAAAAAAATAAGRGEAVEANKPPSNMITRAISVAALDRERRANLDPEEAKLTSKTSGLGQTTRWCPEEKEQVPNTPQPMTVDGGGCADIDGDCEAMLGTSEDCPIPPPVQDRAESPKTGVSSQPMSTNTDGPVGGVDRGTAASIRSPSKWAARKKDAQVSTTHSKQQKSREQRNKEYKNARYMDSPPGSPPCGWDHNISSTGGRTTQLGDIVFHDHFLDGSWMNSQLSESIDAGDKPYCLANSLKEKILSSMPHSHSTRLDEEAVMLADHATNNIDRDDCSKTVKALHDQYHQISRSIERAVSSTSSKSAILRDTGAGDEGFNVEDSEAVSASYGGYYSEGPQSWSSGSSSVPPGDARGDVLDGYGPIFLSRGKSADHATAARKSGGGGFQSSKKSDLQSCLPTSILLAKETEKRNQHGGDSLMFDIHDDRFFPGHLSSEKRKELRGIETAHSVADSLFSAIPANGVGDSFDFDAEPDPQGGSDLSPGQDMAHELKPSRFTTNSVDSLRKSETLMASWQLSDSEDHHYSCHTPSRSAHRLTDPELEGPVNPSRRPEEDLDLLYDPTLDCYYDPKTNRYYELK